MRNRSKEQLCQNLKHFIDEKKIPKQVICESNNINANSYRNLVYAPYSTGKKVFDQVAEAVGFKIEGTIKALYNEAFNIGNNTTSFERYAQELENAAEEITSAPDPAPVDVEPIVEAEEDIAYSDEHPFYQEAEPEEAPAPAISALEALKADMNALIEEGKELEGKAAELKQQLKEIEAQMGTIDSKLDVYAECVVKLEAVLNA